MGRGQQKKALFERRLSRRLWRARALAFFLLSPLLLFLYYVGIAQVFAFENVGLVPAVINAALLAAGVVLYVISFRAVRIANTPPLAVLVWLRKFGRERRDAFRLSNVVDRLGRYGVCTLTLEDESFTRSGGREARLRTLIFWVVALVGVAATAYWADQYQRYDFILFFDYEYPTPPLNGILMITGIVIALSSPLVAWLGARMLAKGRSLTIDDIDARLHPDRPIPRGAFILPVPDEIWQDAVRRALENCDAVMVDVSALTEHIEWEIQQAVALAPVGACLYAVSESASQDTVRFAEIKQQLARLVSYEPEEYFVYPDERRASVQAHERRLRALVGVAIDAGLRAPSEVRAPPPIKRQRRAIWPFFVGALVVVAGLFALFMQPWRQQPQPAQEWNPEMVSIGADTFAVSRTEITFGQWDACVQGGGCDGYVPDDHGWGRGERPVINVSWHDAQSYIRWLNDQTGERYRLPTAEEWRIAAVRPEEPESASYLSRAPWGYCDETAEWGMNYLICMDNRTRPVGSFRPNPFGLADIYGNVAEWGEGDAFDLYRRPVLGGSWNSLYPADGESFDPDRRSAEIGFRIARSESSETP